MGVAESDFAEDDEDAAEKADTVDTVDGRLGLLSQSSSLSPTIWIWLTSGRIP